MSHIQLRQTGNTILANRNAFQWMKPCFLLVWTGPQHVCCRSSGSRFIYEDQHLQTVWAVLMVTLSPACFKQKQTRRSNKCLTQFEWFHTQDPRRQKIKRWTCVLHIETEKGGFNWKWRPWRRDIKVIVSMWKAGDLFFSAMKVASVTSVYCSNLFFKCCLDDFIIVL